MIVRKDCITFQVMGQEINLYSEELEYGRSTVAEMGNYYHYLGDEIPGIAAAIYAWQEANNRELSNEELRQIMLDNHLISEGI
jgi:hypothetical protein